MPAVLRRIAQAGLTLVSASVLVWCLQLLAPGDPARRLLRAGGIDSPTPAQLDATRAELGLDQPGLARLLGWLFGAVRGDLGLSWVSGRPVADELADRLPATVRLTLVALGIAVAVGIPLGLLAAGWRGRWPDHGARALMFLGAATPSFVVGAVVLDVVVLGMGAGRVLSDGSWAGAVLPAIPIAVGAAAGWARVLRNALVEASTAPHLTVATARGATPLRVLVVHTLPGAAPALLSAVGMTVGSLLAGAAIVETVFTWPGIGRYLVDSVMARDVPAVQALVLIGVLAYVVTSLLVDVVVAVIDPPRAR